MDANRTRSNNNPAVLHAASRRALFKHLAGAVGAAYTSRLISGAGLTIALAYSRQLQAGINAGKLFDLKAMTTLARICELVIPATATPSAADVDVHGFIDNQLQHCFAIEQQQQIQALLAQIDEYANRNYQIDFYDCTEQQQLALLNALDVGKQPFNAASKDSFRFLKSLIVFGFFTSEVGATKALRYQAIPGGFKGSIPYRQGEASWAPTLWI